MPQFPLYGPHIVLAAETRLPDDVLDCEIRINIYSLLRHNRSATCEGGVRVFIRSCFCEYVSQENEESQTSQKKITLVYEFRKL